jgi:phage/plasmid-associated DNA primase
MAKYSYITGTGEVREVESDNSIIDSLRAATAALQNKRQLSIQEFSAQAQARLTDSQAALNKATANYRTMLEKFESKEIEDKEKEYNANRASEEEYNRYIEILNYIYGDINGKRQY